MRVARTQLAFFFLVGGALPKRNSSLLVREYVLYSCWLAGLLLTYSKFVDRSVAEIHRRRYLGVVAAVERRVDLPVAELPCAVLQRLSYCCVARAAGRSRSVLRTVGISREVNIRLKIESGTRMEKGDMWNLE